MPNSNPLRNAIDKFKKELGIPTLAKLWKVANVDVDRWNKLTAPDKPKRNPDKQDIDELVEGLRRAKYHVSIEQETSLYQAIGRVVNLAVNSLPNLTCPAPLAAPDMFAGRDDELAELKTKLKEGELVAITALGGLGGIGKTTLARQLAYDLYYETEPNKTFRAVIWLEVARQPDEGLLLERVGVQAEREFTRGAKEDLSQLATRIRTTLREAINEKCSECGANRILFVFDDVWEDGVEVVKRVKEVRPANTTVLVTTRLESVAALLVGNPRLRQSLDRLSPQSGAAMLVEYLPDIPNPSLQELSQTLYGYTLALRLAGLRLQREGPAQLTNHLAQYRTALPAGTPFAQLGFDLRDTREDSLTATLYYSYEALSEQEKTCFRLLGMLAYDQRFDLPLLAAVWLLSEIETKKYATQLQQMGLLEITNSGYGDALDSQDWYRIHPVLHSYAFGLLRQQPEEETTAFFRYTNHVIKIERQFSELPQNEWKQLNPQLPHIEAVGNKLMEQLASSKMEEVLLRPAFDFFFDANIYLSIKHENRQIAWLETGLALSRQLQELQAEILFLHNIGVYYSHRGYHLKAQEYLNQESLLVQKSGNLENEAADLLNTGWMHELNGDTQKALRCYSTALNLARVIGDRALEANIISNIGVLYSTMGDKSKSLEYLNQALPVFRMVSSKSSDEAIFLNNLGLGYSNLNENEKALECYSQALKLRRAIGDLRGEAISLNNIGLAYHRLRNYQKALEYHNQSLPLRLAANDLGGEANSCLNIGSVYNDMGNIPKAIEYISRCVALQEQIGHPDLGKNRQFLASLRKTSTS